MCEKITKSEIVTKIVELKPLSVQVIQNHKNKSEACMYVSGRIFTCGFEIDYDFEALSLIKGAVNDNVLVMVFTDKELQEAWIDSYLQGGITEDEFDRRADFHPFNVINELFAIDRFTLYKIIGEDEVHAKWMEGIIDWYRNQLI